MPFPWEQAIQAGIQIGTQKAAQHKASGSQEKEIGKAFDELDKQVAAYLTPLLAQPTITLAQLNEVAGVYGQLQGFAQQYSGVTYVARQWADEQPRYAQVLQALTAKLPPAGSAVVTDASGQPVGTIQGAQTLIPGVSNTVLMLGGILALVLVMRR